MYEREHVQRIVNRLWDEDTQRKTDISLVILGSSSLLVQEGLGESLARRRQGTLIVSC